MLRKKSSKISILSILFIISSCLIGYGVIYSTAEENELITVGILDPDYGEVVSGKVMIRATIFHPHPNWGYTVSILINGTEISSSLPFEWDSTTVDDGWWNVTVQVKDTKGNVGSDEVLIYTYNTQVTYRRVFIELTVYAPVGEWREFCSIDFDLDFKANAIAIFSGYLEASSPDWFNFGFRIDDQDIIMVAFNTRIDSIDVFYSHIFSNIQPGSHKISFYCKSTTFGSLLMVPSGPFYACYSIAII